ncbi:MAG: MFS transporter [Bacillota bacterium]
MTPALRACLALAFVHQVAQYASRPLIPLLATDLGAGSMEVGLIAGAYSTVQLLFAIGAGKLVDRVGARLPALGGSLLLLVGVAGLTLAWHWALLLLLQMLAGLAHLYVQLGYQSIVTGEASGAQREYNVGLLTFLVSAGQSAGPLIGGWAAEFLGNAGGMWAATAVSAVGLGLAWFLPRRAGGTAKPRHAGSTWSLLKDRDIAKAVYVGVAVLFAMDVLTTYFPLYAQQAGLSAGAIGLALTVRGAATMAVRPFMGRILGRFGRQAVVIGSLIAGGGSIMLYGIWTNLWVVLAVSALAGLALGLAQPLTIVMVTDAASEEQRGMALGLRLMGNRLGQAVSPVLFGFLATGLGLAPVFWISGGLLAASAALGRRGAPRGTPAAG